MIIKHCAVNSDKILVTFQLPATIWAETVHLVGDFNDWNRHSHPLRRLQNDCWEITLELDQGGVYQFRYLVDGAHWQNDWHADRYVPNPFGGDNSVLET
jgi:1,4-alpha-glucan branching enzyme